MPRFPFQIKVGSYSLTDYLMENLFRKYRRPLEIELPELQTFDEIHHLREKEDFRNDHVVYRIGQVIIHGAPK